MARFRVHGEALPDPAFLTGTIDLAAMENGGRLIGCSDAFYSSAGNLILPGRARVHGRRLGERPAARTRQRLRGRSPWPRPGVLRQVEIDTSYFVGNAPGWVRLLAGSGGSGGQALPGAPDLPADSWRELLPETRVQPDTRHRFLVHGQAAVTHVRLDVIPDGGLARLRVLGEIVPEALADLRQRWQAARPSAPDPAGPDGAA